MLNRVLIGAFIICLLFITGLIAYNDYRELNQLYLVVDLETSASGVSQIFFDAGRGYNEQDSSSIGIQNRSQGGLGIGDWGQTL